MSTHLTGSLIAADYGTGGPIELMQVGLYGQLPVDPFAAYHSGHLNPGAVTMKSPASMRTTFRRLVIDKAAGLRFAAQFFQSARCCSFNLSTRQLASEVADVYWEYGTVQKQDRQ
jgi:hypothetical protein